jgi:hypothetical protein
MDQPRKLKYCPICGDVLYDPIWTFCVQHAFEARYQSRLDKLLAQLNKQDDQQSQQPAR